MRVRSHYQLGVAAAALVLLGWTLGSMLSPPVAQTQGRSQGPPLAPVPTVTAPRLVRPIRPTLQRRPKVGRNPFVFEMAAASLAETRAGGDAPPSGVPNDAAEAVVASAPPLWQLAGMAQGPGDEMTAVITGGGDVHLSRAGDVLPDGTSVVSVVSGRVELLAPDGAALVLVLR